MTDLASRRCEPCKSGEPALTPEQIEPLRAQVHADWEVVGDAHHLRRVFRFQNFRDALAYLNLVGALAEEQFHHPDLELSWGRVGVEIWTHKIDGLREADFVFAAKCDQLFTSAS